MSYLCMHAPMGPLTVFEEAGAIVAVEWGRGPEPRTSPLLFEAKAQLEAYFDGTRRRFELPLTADGSAFEKAVWDEMARIDYGATCTYGDIALRLGAEARAVGAACGANPIPVIVPCHRVLGAGGRLVGYSSGAGIETKRALLVLEGTLLV